MTVKGGFGIVYMQPLQQNSLHTSHAPEAYGGASLLTVEPCDPHFGAFNSHQLPNQYAICDSILLGCDQAMQEVLRLEGSTAVHDHENGSDKELLQSVIAPRAD